MWVKGRAPCGVLGQRPDWVALGAVRPLQGEALAPCKGKVPNPRSGWCNLLHQLTDGVSRATLECSKERHGRLAEGFIEAWKEEVHEKLPVTWQHMIDLSQEVAESRQRKSIKELREEADKLLGKSNKRKSRDFEQDHDWEM